MAHHDLIVEIESCVAPAKDLLHKGKADQFFPKPLGKTSWVKRSQLVSALSRHGSISTRTGQLPEIKKKGGLSCYGGTTAEVSPASTPPAPPAVLHDRRD